MRLSLSGERNFSSISVPLLKGAGWARGGSKLSRGILSLRLSISDCKPRGGIDHQRVDDDGVSVVFSQEKEEIREVDSILARRGDSGDMVSGKPWKPFRDWGNMEKAGSAFCSFLHGDRGFRIQPTYSV